MICLVAAIILSIETNFYTGLSVLPGALQLYVLDVLVVEFAPGECYHRQLDWLLTRFEWV